MFKIFNKILPITQPPASSQVLQLLSEDDPSLFQSPFALKAVSLLLSQINLTNLAAKSQFMWQVDSITRYLLKKSQLLAKLFNYSIVDLKYGQKEKQLESGMIELFSAIIRLSDKAKLNSRVKKISAVSVLSLHLDEIEKLASTSSNIRLIFYLMKLKEHFDLNFSQIDSSEIKQDLMKTNYFTSVIERDDEEEQYGLKLTAEHFRYVQYDNCDIDLQSLEWNGNGYCSWMDYLEKTSVKKRNKKVEKSAQFNRIIAHITIYHTLKQNRDQRQYLVGLIDDYDTPLFEYRWLYEKENLAQDINTHIDLHFKLKNSSQTVSNIFTNIRSKGYFEAKLEKQYKWIINYDIETNKYYSQEYKEKLTRNFKYQRALAVQQSTQQKYFMKVITLMKKVFEMLNHLLDNSQFYENFVWDPSLSDIELMFNETECKKLWLKLISISHITKLIAKLLPSFIENLRRTIDKYSKENYNWRLELLKTNRQFLVKFLSLRYNDIDYVESDADVFADLLKDKEFRLNEMLLDRFLDYCQNKSILQNQIKEYLIDNASYYLHSRNHFYTVKLFTLEQRMNIVVKVIKQFKSQKNKAIQLRNLYGKNNKLLDECLFENWQVMTNLVVMKANGSLQKGLRQQDNKQQKSRMFQDYITKLIQISDETFNRYDGLSFDEMDFVDIVMAVGKILKSCKNVKHCEVLKIVVEQNKSLLSLVFEQKFSYQTISSFLKIHMISKMIYNTIDDDYSDRLDDVIPEDKLSEIAEIMRQLINIVSDIGYTSLSLCISQILKSQSHNSLTEAKINIDFEIFSTFINWENVIQRTGDFDFKRQVDINKSVLNISNLINCNIPALQKIVTNIFENKIKNSEINVQTSGTDYQILNSVMKEGWNVFLWVHVNYYLDMWIAKYQFLNKVWNQVAEKFKQQKYEMLNHFFTIYQQQVQNNFQRLFEKDIASTQKLNKVFEIIFNTYSYRYYSTFGQSDFLKKTINQLENASKKVQQARQYLLLNPDLDQKIKQQYRKKCNDIQYLDYFSSRIISIFNSLNEFEPQTIPSFVKKLKEVEISTVNNCALSLLTDLEQHQYINKCKHENPNLKILLNKQTFMTTNKCKLNTLILINQFFKQDIKDIYYSIIIDSEFLTYKPSSKITQPIEHLTLDQKLFVYNLYRNKIDNFIKDANPNTISFNALKVSIDVVLHTQASITMYHPEINFYPKQFLSKILQIYNTDNQLTGLGKYLVLQSLTPKKYRYNVRQIILITAKQLARENYHQIAFRCNKLDIKQLLNVIDQHTDKLVKQLPIPYSRSNIIGEIINELQSLSIGNNYNFEKEDLESYGWLIKCIIEPRTNYVQKNLFAAVLNTILINPYAIDSLIKQIGISKLIGSIQWAQDFLLVISEYLSYKPEIFYNLIDEILKNIGCHQQLNTTRSLLNVLIRCINNICNITNKQLHSKNIEYLKRFRNLSDTLIMSETLSNQLFCKLSKCKFYRYLNSVACMEYKLKIFERIGVYPTSSTISMSDFSNPPDIFQREKNNNLTEFKDMSIYPLQFSGFNLENAIQFKDIRLDSKYLSWFEEKAQCGFDRNTNEIIDLKYQNMDQFQYTEKPRPQFDLQQIEKEKIVLQDEPNRQLQKQEKKSKVEQQELKIKQEDIEQVETKPTQPQLQAQQPQHLSQPKSPAEFLDIQFTQKIDEYNTSQLLAADYIKYLNIDREQFMKSSDTQKNDYLQLKLKQLVRKKKKELKKILIASECYLMNGQDWTINLKDCEKLINDEIEKMKQLEWYDFCVLKGNPILQKMVLTPDALKIINYKKNQQDDDDNKANEELQNESQDSGQSSSDSQSSDCNQNNNEQAPVVPPIENPPATIQIENPLQIVPPIKQQQKKQQSDSQLITNINTCIDKMNKQFNDKIQQINNIIHQLTHSLEFYQDTEELSDELICFTVYQFLNKPYDSKFYYDYAISGLNNYLKFGNLLTRRAYDVFTKSNLLPKSIFSSTEQSPLNECYHILNQIDKLNRLYPYLFFDTNSNSYQLAKYNTLNYEIEKEYDVIKFNVVKLFLLPSENTELVRIIEKINIYLDNDETNLHNMLSSFFQTVGNPLKQSHVIFKNQKQKLINIIEKSVVIFSQKSHKHLEALVSERYNFFDINFPDNKIYILGEMLEASITFTKKLNKILELRMVALSQQSISPFNYFNLLEERQSDFRKYRKGSLIDDIIEEIVSKQWFKNKEFMEHYAPKIAEVIQSILSYAALYYKSFEGSKYPAKDTKYIIFIMDSVKEIIFKERKNKIQKTFKHNKSNVTRLLSYISQDESGFDSAVDLNEIDKTLLQFIQKHGAQIINETQCLFSIAPELIKYYNQNMKTMISQTHIFSEKNDEIEINIDRDAVVYETYKQLKRQFQKKIIGSEISIKFNDEIGIDGGGLTNEFLLLFFSELEDCTRGMFTMTETGTFIPSRFVPFIINSKDLFRTIGYVLGKCISQNLLSVSFNLDPYIIKLIYGQKVNLEDLKFVNRQLYDSFIWMLESDVTQIEQPYEIINQFMDCIPIVLPPKSEHKIVTNENKLNYVNQYVHWLLVGSISNSLYQLILGVHTVCPLTHLRSIFTLEQLQNYIRGKVEFDIELCKKQVQLKFCNFNTNQIVWLFEIISEMKSQQVERFLVFVTGRKRLPWNKFEDFKITLNQKKGSLPSSNTCSFKLNLGYYESKDSMKQKLQMAIAETQGFHIY